MGAGVGAGPGVKLFSLGNIDFPKRGSTMFHMSEEQRAANPHGNRSDAESLRADKSDGGLSTTALLVTKILERPDRFDGWSLQGFGMLRLYLPGRARLHVWDSRFAVENVSTIHNHPWHFDSEVVWGHIANLAYRVVNGEPTHHEQVIVCGPGGHAVGEPVGRCLKPTYRQDVFAGHSYRQMASELHESRPDDGTVSIIRRDFLADTEHARVFFPVGTPWVSAEPRPATTGEVRAICDRALALALKSKP